MLAGESYLVSAQRELAEELGIQGVALKRHFDIYHTDTNNRVWGRVYSCTYDGEIILQEEEVESGDYYSLETILRLNEQEPFTPDGMNVLKRFMVECER